MDYHYLADVAEELDIDCDDLKTAVEELMIELHQLAVPPHEVAVSPAVDGRDAERLRSHFRNKR